TAQVEAQALESPTGAPGCVVEPGFLEPRLVLGMRQGEKHRTSVVLHVQSIVMDLTLIVSPWPSPDPLTPSRSVGRRVSQGASTVHGLGEEGVRSLRGIRGTLCTPDLTAHRGADSPR